VVAGDVHPDRVALADEVDRRPRPLVLQGGDEAVGPGDRPGQLGLRADLVDLFGRVDHLDRRDDGQGEQRDRERGGELEPDRDTAQGVLPPWRSGPQRIGAPSSRTDRTPVSTRRAGGVTGQRMWARAWAFATRYSRRVSRTIFTESLLRASHSTKGVSGVTPSASRISGVG